MDKLNRVLNSKIGKALIAFVLMAIALWMSGVEDVAGRFLHFPLIPMACALLLLCANLLVVTFRFWCLLFQFSFQVPFVTALRATLSGYIAGLLMISLFGQIVGRQAVLSQAGIPSAINSAIAVYERILVFVIGGLFGSISATYLLGPQLVREFFSRTPLLEVTIIIIISFAVSLMIGAKSFENRIIRQALDMTNLRRIMLICMLTTLGQLLVLASFVVAILALRPEMNIIVVFAAAALISFIASIPISVNGWGVREIASIFVLGKLGIPPEEAVTVSILIGVASTLALIVGELFIFNVRPVSSIDFDEIRSKSKISIQDIEKASAWAIGMFVALTVFFQVHMTFDTGPLNINLADPFAILALASVSLSCLMQRRLPHWRVPKFNNIIAAFSVMLLISFFLGASRFGITQWALGGRLFGWLVLLGYLSAGYLLVGSLGTRGIHHLIETLTILLTSIVLWQSLIRVVPVLGYQAVNLPSNFEAYSGNRNAFALQLITILGLLIAYSPMYARSKPILTNFKRHLFLTVAPAVLVVGIIWTGSRAGILVGTLLLMTAYTINAIKFNQLFRIGLLAILIWITYAAAPIALGFFLELSASQQQTIVPVQSVLSLGYSNDERLATWVYALNLWLDAPVWGGGLGAFVVGSNKWFGHFQVVHSTPLWILAEFGIVGVIVSVYSIYQLAKYAVRKRPRAIQFQRSAFLLLLLSVIIFSLFHEIFYQRIVWLIMGLLLASPFAHKTLESGHAR